MTPQDYEFCDAGRSRYVIVWMFVAVIFWAIVLAGCSVKDYGYKTNCIAANQSDCRVIEGVL